LPLQRGIKAIIDNQEHIPDYYFKYDKEEDKIYIYPKAKFIEKFTPKPKPTAIDQIKLKSKTYDTAIKHAMGFDVYFIEQEWRMMLGQKNSIPEKPDGSFINYLKWNVTENKAC